MPKEGLIHKKNYMVWIDLLRIVATFATIVIHVSEENYQNTISNPKWWNVFNIYDSIGRCSVPIFVMISGTLF